MAESLKIVVADTFAGEKWLHKDWVSRFPNTTLIHHDLTGKGEDVEPHPHGGMVAGILLTLLLDKPVELHFVRWLDASDQDSARWHLLELVEDLKPHICHNSWGEAPSPYRTIRNFQATNWSAWVHEANGQIMRSGTAWTAAMGNRNLPTLRDHHFPWVLMQGAISVGAVQRDGHMAEFSSDGRPECVAVGVHRWIVNPLNGRNEAGSGTSFSSPLVASLIGRWLIDGTVKTQEEILSRIVEVATRPEGAKPETRDPLWGRGNLEPEAQKIANAEDVWRRIGLPHPASNDSMALDMVPLWFGLTRVR